MFSSTVLIDYNFRYLCMMAVVECNMIMAWPLKSAPKFSLTIINVYKIKIAVVKLVYFLLFISSA